jgi:hypothetical protein
MREMPQSVSSWIDDLELSGQVVEERSVTWWPKRDYDKPVIDLRALVKQGLLAGKRILLPIEIMGPGVYGFDKHGKIKYAGKAKRMVSRIAAFHKNHPDVSYDTIWIVPGEVSIVRKAEKEIIRQIKPPVNQNDHDGFKYKRRPGVIGGPESFSISAFIRDGLGLEPEPPEKPFKRRF